MSRNPACMRTVLAALALVAAMSVAPVAAQAVKSTECTKVGICYCVSSDLKPVIEARIAQFRQLAAEQRKAGKTVGYLAVPLSPAGGGYTKLNFEVAEAAKAKGVSETPVCSRRQWRATRSTWHF